MAIYSELHIHVKQTYERKRYMNQTMLLSEISEQKASKEKQ